MRILVTGASGLVGGHLVSELLNRGHEVFAGIRRENSGFSKPVVSYVLDLLDNQQIVSMIKEINPDGIIHLAAQSRIQVAWQDPATTFLVNTIGTINLIEAVKRHAPAAKIITVGSSEEYGATAKKGEPLTEKHPCCPQNPYASSKLVTGQIALQMAHSGHLNIIHVRPFNHFGPGQPEGFVVSDFASQIARIEKLQYPPVIKVGDLSVKRDFMDVRDVVDAYVLLLEKDVPSGVYNICSGFPRTVKDILDVLLKKSNISIDVKTEPERFRPSEVPIFIGSSDKIHQATGWKPKRKFEESLHETLEWWRSRLDQSIERSGNF